MKIVFIIEMKFGLESFFSHFTSKEEANERMTVCFIILLQTKSYIIHITRKKYTLLLTIMT